MVKTRRAPSAPPLQAVLPERAAVTPERFGRLFRLVEILGARPQSRTTLLRRLRLDLRGFYRDLEFLRSAGIGITLAKGRYTLDESAASVRELLPFPDPHLTFGEVQRLARGRTLIHRKLQDQIAAVLS